MSHVHVLCIAYLHYSFMDQENKSEWKEEIMHDDPFYEAVGQSYAMIMKGCPRRTVIDFRALNEDGIMLIRRQWKLQHSSEQSLAMIKPSIKLVSSPTLRKTRNLNIWIKLGSHRN